MIRLASMLRKPKFVTGAGFLVLIGLIWMLGSRFGLSTTQCLLLTAVVIVIWLGILLFQYVREVKQAKFIEESIDKQGDEQKAGVRPDRREDIDALKEQLRLSIQELKVSRLGKRALYALPWYMIIGPPASGKSTVLRHSGLDFPHLDSSGRGVKGVGGTRNCDWWFANEAIMLDTAGRYAIQEEDREEWLAFLGFLRKARRRKPINGVIVAISIEDFFALEEDRIEEHAKAIRTRIDELTERLSVQLPVYLLLTKCDLLNGFVEFFSDDFFRTGPGRDQILGCTLTAIQGRHASPERIFTEEFDRLYGSLRARMVDRLDSVRQEEVRRKVYMFPLQFASLRDPLARFVDLVFKGNPYTGKPFFRGFYFTSGTQEGAPLDNVVRSLARRFDFPEEKIAEFQPEMQKKSYFIRDLLKEVAFLDADLAERTTMRHRPLVWVLSAVAVLACAGLLWWRADEYAQNRRFLYQVEKVAREVKEDVNVDPRKFEVGDLNELENLYTELERLEDYTFLFASEDTIAERGRTLYFSKLRSILGKPVFEGIHKELTRLGRRPLQEERRRYRELLRVYKLLVHHHSVPEDTTYVLRDSTAIDRAILDSWQRRPETRLRGAVEGIRPHIRRYRERLIRQETDSFSSDSDGTLIPQVEEYLREIPASGDIYGETIEEANSKSPAVELSDILGSSQNIFRGTYTVPGAYTVSGWRYFREIVVNSRSRTIDFDWVVGRPDDDMDRFRREGDRVQILQERYLDEYEEHWLNLLREVQVRRFRTIRDAARELRGLYSGRSALVGLFEAVARHTRLRDSVEHDEEEADEGEVNARPEITSVENRFESLHDFVGASDRESDGGLRLYLQDLTDIQQTMSDASNSAEEAKELADRILNSKDEHFSATLDRLDGLRFEFEPELWDIVEPLLAEPIRNTWPVILDQAAEELNHLWQEEVLDVFGDLDGFYPFSPRAGQDISERELTDFLGANGVFQTFCTDHLDAFVYNYEQERPKRWKDQGITFAPGFWSAWRRATSIESAISRTPIRFRLRPDPNSTTDRITRSELTIGDQRLVYGNWGAEYQSLRWDLTMEVAWLQVEVDDRAFGYPLESENTPWAFIRLLDRADQGERQQGSLVWQLQDAGEEVTVSYQMSVDESIDPFVPEFFHFTCPRTICTR